MQFQYKVLGIAAVIAILLLTCAFFLLPKEQCKNSLRVEAIDFCSDSIHPTEQLKALGKEAKFIIAVQIDSENKNVQESAKSLSVLLGVLQAIDKNAVSLVQQMNSSGKTAECYTNFGDPKQSVKISSKECTALLGEEGAVKIKILLADSSLNYSKVDIQGKTITITPKSNSDSPRISSLLLQAMYEDTKEIIEKINEIVSRLG